MNLGPLDVVEVLRVGLAGLAFILAFLGYRLLALEQAAKEPRPERLRASRTFMFQCITLAVIVGIFELIPAILPKAIDESEVARCRDSFDLLKEQMQRAENYGHLSSAISELQERCFHIIEFLDERR